MLYSPIKMTNSDINGKHLGGGQLRGLQVVEFFMGFRVMLVFGLSRMDKKK